MSLIDQVRSLRISDYDYPLPDDRIAKHPLAQRDQCKLLELKDGDLSEHRFYEVPSLLEPGTMLVYNNTRVINARLRFRKPGENGAVIEIFCLEPEWPRDYERIFQSRGACKWLCLVGNNKRWKSGELELDVQIGDDTVNFTAQRVAQRGNAYEIKFTWDNDDVTFASILEAIGEIPIPPYLNRKTEVSDNRDYQTVYSRFDGSVAAPTAGLHFTEAVLDACDKRGIVRRELTLHVGAGTFQPVKSENIGGHEMHTEFISVPRSLLADLLERHGKPVVAVGTTSVRTLESLYYVGRLLEANPDASEEQLRVTQWMPYDEAAVDITMEKALGNIIAYLDRHEARTYVGSTQLMIAPGFKYRLVDGMITNFHQPQSTLLLLVAAFVGNDQWRKVYDYALEHDFRFLSYGDACLFLGKHNS